MNTAHRVLFGGFMVSAVGMGYCSYRLLDAHDGDHGGRFERTGNAIRASLLSGIQDSYTAGRHVETVKALSSRKYTLENARQLKLPANLTDILQASIDSLPVFLCESKADCIFCGTASRLHNLKARAEILQGRYLRVPVIKYNEQGKINSSDIILAGTDDRRKPRQLIVNIIKDYVKMASNVGDTVDQHNFFSCIAVLELRNKKFTRLGSLGTAAAKSKIQNGSFTICCLHPYKEECVIVYGTARKSVCDSPALRRTLDGKANK